MLSEAERFNRMVSPEPTSGCWLWTGSIATNGYARFYLDGRSVAASRVAARLAGRPISDGTDACHSCDNRACVNPDHIFEGTRSANMYDCGAKGRNAMQRHPEKNPLLRLRPEQLRRGEKHGCAILTESDVAAIRAEASRGDSSTTIGLRRGLSPGHIRKIVSGSRWRSALGGGEGRERVRAM